jgi:hypothetical protein
LLIQPVCAVGSFAETQNQSSAHSVIVGNLSVAVSTSEESSSAVRVVVGVTDLGSVVVISALSASLTAFSSSSDAEFLSAWRLRASHIAASLQWICWLTSVAAFQISCVGCGSSGAGVRIRAGEARIGAVWNGNASGTAGGIGYHLLGSSGTVYNSAVHVTAFDDSLAGTAASSTNSLGSSRAVQGTT